MQTAANPWTSGRFETSGQDVQIPAEGAQLKGYLAAPQAEGRHPGVLVIHENKGLVPYLRDVADGLASEGFVALAPDLLSREGGTDRFPDPTTEVPPILSGIPRDRHVADLQAALDYLEGRDNVGKVGVIGFCFGGGLTWLITTRRPGLAASVPFYGPNPPLEDVKNIRCPVLAVYAENDERINQGLPALRDALRPANVPHDIRVYPNSAHAFHNHHNPERYNPDTARQAWQAAVAFLREHARG